MNTITFNVGQKPVEPADIELAKNIEDFKPSNVPYTKVSENLERVLGQYTKEVEETGSVSNPIAAAKQLSTIYAQASHSLVKDYGTEYNFDQQLRGLEKTGDKIIDLLSGISSAQATKLDAFQAEKKDALNRLTRLVNNNLVDAFLTGARAVEQQTDAGPARLESSSEYKQCFQYLQNGFENATETSGSNGRYRRPTRSETSELYTRLRNIGEGEIQRYSGYQEPGQILGEIIQNINKLDGGEFNTACATLLSVIDPDGRGYGQIEKVGRSAANDWKERVEADVQKATEVGNKVKFARLT